MGALMFGGYRFFDNFWALYQAAVGFEHWVAEVTMLLLIILLVHVAAVLDDLLMANRVDTFIPCSSIVFNRA